MHYGYIQCRDSGQIYLISKTETFYRNIILKSYSLKLITFKVQTILKNYTHNQAKSKALNLFQNVTQSENNKSSLWNYCTI